MILKEPAMLLLLALLPLLWKITARARRLQNEAAAMLRGEKKISNVWKRKTALHLGSFAALILALAQPAWNPHPGPLTVQGRDIVIALDISRSMLANDVFPTRLDSARIALYESLDSLRGQRIGLITFAGSASVRVPLTLDHNFVRYMLERAAPSDADVGSTSLQAAIEKAVDVALSESKKGKQDILLFTDGEDHISDIEATTEALRTCGARVLIIGLGDPVAGAKIPSSAGADTWMQYNGEDVITRLDEEKLQQLSAKSPNVSYHAARTRPFDLMALYQQMITNTSGQPVSDETQLVYTDGYPFFIALALALWILPLSKRLFPAAMLLVLIAGCTPEAQRLQENTYSGHLEQGRTLWGEAQGIIKSDPRAALITLDKVRRAFLQAALCKPGDRAAAQQIAGSSAQIHEMERAVKEQEKAEKDLQKKMQEAIEQLAALTERETALSKKSQQLVDERPSPSLEEKIATLLPARAEQIKVGEGTKTVLKTITEVQTTLQEMLAITHAGNEGVPPTELDETIDELAAAREAQQAAIDHLDPDRFNLPKGHSAFRSAARKMQAALRQLSAQSKGGESKDSSDPFAENEMERDFDEDMDWSDSDASSNQTAPMDSSDIKSALENRTLPVPNYTAEEILMEEAANMEKRARQKSDRAGAGVEKNW